MARRSNTAPVARGHMGIRSRLMLLLVVPLAGMLAVTGYAMFTAVQQSRDAAVLSGDAQVSLASYQLIDALQAERQALAAGQPTDDELRSAVTAASEELRIRAEEQGGALQEMTTRALDRAEAAGSLAVTNTGGLVAVDGYTPAISALLAVSRAGFDPEGAIDDAPATTSDLLATAQESGALERDLVQSMALRGMLAPDTYARVSELAAAQDIQSSQAAAVSTSDLAVRIDRVGDALAAASPGRDALFFAAATGTAVEPAAVDNWIQGADSRVAELLDLRNGAATQAVAAVDDLASSSRQVLLVAAGALILVLLVSAVLVRSAIRSIARPLTELASQAEEVAVSRLPEAVSSQQSGAAELRLPPIRATGATEVQEVAGAFNDIQETALRLAGEQAVLRRNLADALTNLGRRNQALLGRQLDFISSLEQRETDPAFLEHLFKLDHLASRMRRNAESLLILTGSETPRRRRKPAPLSEVVRAAMSEVEDFERVRLGQLGDATLTGPVVIDLVHMLAELIENALRFSPPDTTVEIDGRSLGQGGYSLAVIDHGVGMADVEIVAANQRLAGLDEVDGMPTRYLGQYVIAKLATKTGAMVRLQPTSGGRGITAVVSLPATATVGTVDRSKIARPLPGSRAARDQSPELFAPGAGLTAAVVQPDAVIDPAADPFAEPVPTREDLASDPAVVGSDEWTWMPDGVPAEELNGASSNSADEWTSEWAVEDRSTAADSWATEPVSYQEPVSYEDADPYQDADHFQDAVSYQDVEPTPSFDDASIVERSDEEQIAAEPVGDGTWAVDSWTTDTWAADTAADPISIDPLTADSRAADPLAADPFAGDTFSQEITSEEIAAAFPTPPPPPQAIPDQTWVARPGDPAQAEPPAAAPDPEPAPLAGVAPAAPTLGGLGGGLTRRVPGASLNDSPLGQSAPEPVVEKDRSADGVRSMLSAFQGGRSRGLGGVAVQEPGAAPSSFDATASFATATFDRGGPAEGPGSAEPTTNPSDQWTADHIGVEQTSELEDPRDH